MINQTEHGPAQSKPTATVERLKQSLDATGFPTQSAWQTATPILFDHDWKGQNPDPGRSTEVRLLWLPETLFLRFTARYRDLTVFEDCDDHGRREHLWDRDVDVPFDDQRSRKQQGRRSRSNSHGVSLFVLQRAIKMRPFSQRAPILTAEKSAERKLREHESLVLASPWDSRRNKSEVRRRLPRERN